MYKNARREILKRASFCAAAPAGAFRSATAEGGSYRGDERRTQRLLSRILLVLFLAGQEKYVTALPVEIYSKIYPQPLWNVENISVEKFHTDFTSTDPVEKI